MSFEARFKVRYDRVIVPAIGQVYVGDAPLVAHRVDKSTISDSIIAEIVEGITTSAAVVVDITTIGLVDGRPVRNANVLYELGLAHAIRRPEDVLVFRSDDDPLLFDVSGIRVLSYSPDADPDAAVDFISESLAGSLQLGQLLERSVVEHASRSLDPVALALLMRAAGLPSMGPDFEDLEKAARNPHLIPCLHRLLELELLDVVPRQAMGRDGPLSAGMTDLTRFEITPLGSEVVWLTMYRTGVWEAFAATTPGMAEHLEDWKNRNPEYVSIG